MQEFAENDDPETPPRQTPMWQGVEADRRMQVDHTFIWDAIVRDVDTGLENTRVLDIGCNQGGFLRRLADRERIGQGYGFDVAIDAIEEAESFVAGRPLHFAVAERVPQSWRNFDVAFSHEVLYLLHDIPMHAHEVFEALRPGGTYFAVLGAHADNPLTELWHAALAKGREMPPVYSLDDVASAFDDAGFEVSARPLEVGFVPYPAHVFPSFYDALLYFANHKIIFKFQRPFE